ncbi:hypothetical protein ACYCSE_01590 [Paenibacillus sp. SEL1]
MNTLPARFQEKGTVHVLPREDAAHARAKAEKLKAFTDQEDEREHAVMLRLVADQGQSYRGADIWDVMLSLGMEYTCGGSLCRFDFQYGWGTDRAAANCVRDNVEKCRICARQTWRDISE